MLSLHFKVVSFSGQIKLKSHPGLFSFAVNLPQLNTYLYFDSFFVIFTPIVLRARGMVFLNYYIIYSYQFFYLANHKESCRWCSSPTLWSLNQIL